MFRGCLGGFVSVYEGFSAKMAIWGPFGGHSGGHSGATRGPFGGHSPDLPMVCRRFEEG